MILEIILLSACFFSILITYWASIEEKSYKINFIQSVLICIITPIIEEVIFRHGLFEFTKHLNYYKELNALLFGLMHILNFNFF